jgi:CYTH domain-containing protein
LKIYEVTVIRKQTFVLEIPVNDDQDGMDAYQKINMEDVEYCVADEQITWEAEEK